MTYKGKKVCRTCFKILPAEAEFCSVCGKAVNKETEIEVPTGEVVSIDSTFENIAKIVSTDGSFFYDGKKKYICVRPGSKPLKKKDIKKVVDICDEKKIRFNIAVNDDGDLLISFKTR